MPVLNRERHIIGIFSENTVFLYLARDEICEAGLRKVRENDK